jgi:hypothetical protein
MCVDTEYSNQHCGNGNKTCKYGDTCCAGQSVNFSPTGTTAAPVESLAAAMTACSASATTQGDAYARARKYTVSSKQFRLFELRPDGPSWDISIYSIYRTKERKEKISNNLCVFISLYIYVLI